MMMAMMMMMMLLLCTFLFYLFFKFCLLSAISIFNSTYHSIYSFLFTLQPRLIRTPLHLCPRHVHIFRNCICGFPPQIFHFPSVPAYSSETKIIRTALLSSTRVQSRSYERHSKVISQTCDRWTNAQKRSIKLHILILYSA